MNFQELIQAIINKVRWLVQDNDNMAECAKAQNGIRVVAEVNRAGEFELNELRFIGRRSDNLYVTENAINYFESDDDCCGKNVAMYDSWDALLSYKEE